MLKTLAGRLRWEKANNVLHVEIPARFAWTAIVLGACLGILFLAGTHVIQHVLEVKDHSPQPFYDLLGWSAFLCFCAGWFLWCLGGKTNLILTRTELILQRKVFGLVLSTRIFQTGTVEHLRYEPPEYTCDAESGYTPSRIKFDANGTTRSFATGISDDEAFALIDRMMEVYEFPVLLSLDYLNKIFP